MLRTVRRASSSAWRTASSEPVVERPMMSIVFAAAMGATLSGGRRFEMRRVVEGAQEPAAAREDDEPRDRGVVDVHERERAAAGRLPAQLADHPAVQHGRGDRPGPDRVDHPGHAVADAAGDGEHRPPPPEYVPSLLGADPA